MLNSLKSVVRRWVRPPLHKPQIRLPHEVLGTEYGGWPLLRDYTPDGALIFSFGVGEDLSFDIAAMNSKGCIVHAFDPTPRSLKWVSQQHLPDTFHFHPIGIAQSDGVAEFFAPEKAEHVSFSAKPAAQSDAQLAIKADVKRLSTIISELGVGSPDILKMDVEGFEYGVLVDILQGDIRPTQILIEFHHRMYGIENKETNDAVDRLFDAGYLIYYVSSSGHEYGFVLKSQIR